MTYDPANGNVASTIPDSAGIAPRTRYTYTAQGQVASITDPMGTVTTFTYDAFGNRLSAVEDAGPGRLNRTTTFGYNAQGDVVSVTDPNGNVTNATYDAGRRLVTTTTPAIAAAPGGMTTTNSYDADGRLLQVQQSSGDTLLRTASATWTPTGRQASATDANGNLTTYAYDLLDRLIRTKDAEGRITAYAYDALSRPVSVSNPAILATPLLTQSWTDNGLRASLTDVNTDPNTPVNRTTTFAYDRYDRLGTTTYPDNTTETYTYDADGNVTLRKTRAGVTIGFAYDGLNRLIKKTPPAGPEVTYSYDLAGRLTGVSDTGATIAAAVSPTGSTVIYATTYTYDAWNRPAKAAWDPAPAATAPSAGPLVTFGHSYDRTNRRIGQTASDNTWLPYPTGPPGTVTYTSTNTNQYSTITGLAPSYDTNGNLIGDGTYTYGYDAENRLVSASGAGNSASYAYDGRGWRKSRTVNGSTTISVTDADNREVLEYDGSTGTIQRWYAHGLGANDVLNQMAVPGGTRSLFVPDIQGSIVATFSSAGALTRSTYLPYGGSAGSAAPFGYTGQRFDAEAGGLNYYRARHYSPALGRFLQTDPVGYTSGANLYAYVGNDPLNLIDPSGLAAQDAGGPAGNLITASNRVELDWLHVQRAEAQAAGDINRLARIDAEIEDRVSSRGPSTTRSAEQVDVGGRLKLLPGEGMVGTYNDLVSAGVKGDNLTPHHVPSANRMALEGVSRGNSVAMNMEQPFPGPGGRHRATFTYGTKADIDMTARDALAAGVWDARRIYRADGLYTPQIRSSLQDLIRMNKTNHPTMFVK